MNALEIMTQGWSWNPWVLSACGGAAAVAVRMRARRGFFAAAMVVVVLALCSPLNALATGVLFSAHMVQHILLLLIAPALLVLSWPNQEAAAERIGYRFAAIPGWAAGVGAMWFWHVPQLCDAAAGSASLHGVQTISLLAMGTAFWWPILAPRRSDRLVPGLGVLYLFTACLACTALGILLTLTPLEACPVFRAPLATGARVWSSLRESVGPERDRQLGGLLMWVPMCFVYMSAILFELARWHGEARKRGAMREVHS